METDVTAWGLARRSLRNHPADVIMGTSLGSVHQVSEALVAVFIGVTIDEAVTPGDPVALAAWLAALAVLFVALALSAAVGYYRLGRAEQRIAHELRVQIAARVLDECGGAERVATTGQVLSLAVSDAARVGRLAGAVGGAVTAVAALAVGAGYLLVVAWALGLVILLGLPVVVTVAQRLAAPLTARSSAEQAAVAEASGMAADLVTGLRVLQGLGAAGAGSARYREASRRARDGRIHAARYAALHEATTLAVGAVLVVAVAWLGGRLAMSGDLTVGQLVASAGLAAFLVFPLQRLGGFAAELAVVRASAQRIHAFLHIPPAVSDGGSAVPAATADLVLDAVVSGSLAGVDLAVAAGEWVGVAALEHRDALVLTDLLARRIDPARGTVRYGGTDLRALDLAGLRAALQVADHDAVLFDGTVAENVGATSRLAAVLAATAADEVLDALPDSARSRVGESGRALSGGQRQRVALARAVATDAPVLVLHEPTTAVDAATEAAIVAGVRALRAGRTTIVITTAPAWLAACDRVVVLRDGALDGHGHHEELLARHTRYRAAVLG